MWEVTLSESNVFLALFFVTDSSYYEEYFGRIAFLICFLNRAKRGEKRAVTRQVARVAILIILG